MERVQEGGDAAEGRGLLGDLDQLGEFPDLGDPAEVYARHKVFIKGGAAPVTPSGQAPAPSPAKQAIDRSKAMKDYSEGRSTTARAKELGIV